MSTVTETDSTMKTPANDGVRDSRATATCAGRRRDGERCTSRILLEDGFCISHSPAVEQTALAEQKREAGIASGEARRELGKTVRQRFAERLEADADEIYDTFRSAWREGDWRAADAAISQALGRPPQAIVGDDTQPVKFILGSLLQQARESIDGEATEDEPPALPRGADE